MNKEKEFESNLEYLKLPYIKDNYKSMSAEAATKELSHMQFLMDTVMEEAGEKMRRASERRIRQARFPVVKTLEEFRWDHPEKINRDLVRHLFGLNFVDEHKNVVFLGPPGMGKTHLAISLAYHACLQGHSVRFETAVNVINKLDTAQKAGNFGQVMRMFTKPDILCLDELGYLPVDRRGADLLFQVITSRYERGSMIITSNREYAKWHVIFDKDKTITSAILDRVPHHCDTVLIEGTSYRMSKRTEV